ncbi:MAG: FtsX-like permease family protein [Gemmatimonadetes bacterium]|nr:MAG: FtsX-like permease family protein [Gemmatimonadota bacterium]
MLGTVRRWGRRLLNLVQGARQRRELDEELAFHLEELARELTRSGLSPAEARREARIRLGSVEHVHQRVREERGVAALDETLRNLRYAVRGLRRSPLFATAFLLTLALSIGAATAAFSVADAALWRPPPYPAAERLAYVVPFDPAVGKRPDITSMDGRSWLLLHSEVTFLDLAALSGQTRWVNLDGEHAAARVRQGRVGSGYFRVLGVSPARGREFVPSEDTPGGPPVAILSHRLWTSVFRADPDVLGRTIRLKGEPHTVVGVMPADFRPEGDVEVWTPLRAEVTGEGGGRNYMVVARVPEGMPLAEADARLAALEAPLDTGASDREVRFGLLPYLEVAGAAARGPLIALLGAIGLMVLVACANLAGLQLARALSRRRETAIRQAVGGGAGALVRQAVVENAVLGVLGGGAGIALAVVLIRAVGPLAASRLGVWQTLALDGRAVAVSLALTLAVTALFSLVPVYQAGARSLHRSLVAGSRTVVGRGSARLRRILVAGQLGLVTPLLFMAGLLVRSYGYLERLDPGFRTDGLVAARASLDDVRYADRESVSALFRETLARLRQTPGVADAAVSLTLPYERALNVSLRLPGTGAWVTTNAVYVTPRVFEVMEIPLLQGRVPTEADRAGGAMAVVVNEAFVARYLKDQPPLDTPLDLDLADGPGAVIVGVVGNVQQSAGWGEVGRPVWETPTIYFSVDQASGEQLRVFHTWFSPSWVIRVSGDPEASIPALRAAFAAAAPHLPLGEIETLDHVVAQAFSRQRFQAGFLAVAAAVSLLLAGIGLYGIVAHDVLARRGEIGVRMALGATQSRALWTVGASGLRLVVWGLLTGMLAAAAVARLLDHLIWGVEAYDPLVFAGVVLSLTLLSAAAIFLPVSRMSPRDPVEVLREE